jgi:phage FluMu gp28-like protein
MEKVTEQASRGEKEKFHGPQLYPYQRRWVEDDARFKIACKARQIGFTFAAAWRVVDKRLHNDGLTVWLSASERQALEAMEHIRRFARELRVVAIFEEDFVKGTLVKQYTVRFPNGSRIVAVPANPDTVRGFAGDVVLDEFAFHRDADAIWRAAFATATRGFQIEIISTPNGTRGKYYELARAAGLVDFIPPESPPSVGQTFLSAEEQVSPPPTCHSPEAREVDEAQEAEGKSFASSASSVWSAHWVDLSLARTQGFVVDVESLRAAIDDEDAWQQEYCCRFLSHAAHYIPPELVVAAEHPGRTVLAPPSRSHSPSAR